MHEFARHALMAYGQEPRTVCFQQTSLLSVCFTWPHFVHRGTHIPLGRSRRPAPLPSVERGGRSIASPEGEGGSARSLPQAAARRAPRGGCPWPQSLAADGRSRGSFAWRAMGAAQGWRTMQRHRRGQRHQEQQMIGGSRFFFWCARRVKESCSRDLSVCALFRFRSSGPAWVRDLIFHQPLEAWTRTLVLNRHLNSSLAQATLTLFSIENFADNFSVSREKPTYNLWSYSVIADR